MKKQIKILVVEDDDLISLQLTLVLRDCGYQVSEPAITGEDAIEKVKKDPPDVAIIDVTLPGELNGIETAKKLASFCDTYFIFTSGQLETDWKKHAEEMNPLAVIEKPFGIFDIKDVIDKAFSAN